MKKLHASFKDVTGQCLEIARQIQADGWMPDYIVGITRGGLIPATLLSHYLDVPMQTLKVSLRDSEECETNCWMSEEAFGYVPTEEQATIGARWDPHYRKNILIVDDINDSGDTLNWIKQDWQNTCLPNETEAWDAVWNRNVRVAVLYNNEASENTLDINYTAESINKLEEDIWIVFPWENWWRL